MSKSVIVVFNYLIQMTLHRIVAEPDSPSLNRFGFQLWCANQIKENLLFQSEQHKSHTASIELSIEHSSEFINAHDQSNDTEMKTKTFADDSQRRDEIFLSFSIVFPKFTIV